MEYDQWSPISRIWVREYDHPVVKYDHPVKEYDHPEVKLDHPKVWSPCTVVDYDHPVVKCRWGKKFSEVSSRNGWNCLPAIWIIKRTPEGAQDDDDDEADDDDDDVAAMQRVLQFITTHVSIFSACQCVVDIVGFSQCLTWHPCDTLETSHSADFSVLYTVDSEIQWYLSPASLATSSASLVKFYLVNVAK